MAGAGRPSTEPEERACLARLDDGDLAGARAGMRHLVENVWQAGLRDLDERIADAELVVFPGEDHLQVGDSHRPEVLAALTHLL